MKVCWTRLNLKLLEKDTAPLLPLMKPTGSRSVTNQSELLLLMLAVHISPSNQTPTTLTKNASPANATIMRHSLVTSFLVNANANITLAEISVMCVAPDSMEIRMMEPRMIVKPAPVQLEASVPLLQLFPRV